MRPDASVRTGRVTQFPFIAGTMKEINRAGADVGLMFIGYNLMRLINISGKEMLKEYLRILSPLFLTFFVFFRRKKSLLATFLFQGIYGPERKNLSPKHIKPSLKYPL